MARPGRPCKICSDPTLCAKVDALLQTGESHRAVSALTGTDRFSIQRHKKHAFPQTASEPENLSELELSDQRLATLSGQLAAQYAAALTTADNRTALDILKVSARIEAERHSRLLEKAEAAAQDDNDPEKQLLISPAQYDHVLKKVRSAYAKAVEDGAIMCPLCSARPVNPRTVQEFIRSHADAHDSAITN
jgi:hypothetical protein